MAQWSTGRTGGLPWVWGKTRATLRWRDWKPTQSSTTSRFFPNDPSARSLSPTIFRKLSLQEIFVLLNNRVLLPFRCHCNDQHDEDHHHGYDFTQTLFLNEHNRIVEGLRPHAESLMTNESEREERLFQASWEVSAMRSSFQLSVGTSVGRGRAAADCLQVVLAFEEIFVSNIDKYLQRVPASGAGKEGSWKSGLHRNGSFMLLFHSPN